MGIGDKLFVNKGGEISETTFDAAKVGDKDLVGFYFSAHWCPPCRGFTPVLKDFYEELNEAQPGKLVVIFVTSDRDEESMKSYFAEHGDYYCFKYEDQTLIQTLKSNCSVNGIPPLAVVNKEGKCLKQGGRADVTSRSPKDVFNMWKEL